MLEIGSLVDGKYKILNKVGQGGMSVVYLAMNEKANKQWAVKEVRKDGIKDFEIVKQGLVAETDILKKLNHPHLPSIIDVIDQDDSFIIIMDYIQGNSLNKALEEYGAQPQEYVIDWAKQLCDVLGYLHSRTPAIIYRDMKPANVMLKPDGNVTLIDFGTAREFKEKNLADTTCLGTVGYAAPEQFGGMGQTDARTDIYCLGATLYHLVTGMNPCEPPYEIKPIREINPSLSSGLERIIMKCTQRDPNDRYQSTAELMYALEHYEEIDDLYRKKQKRKLWSFIVPAALSVVFGITSLWAYSTAQAQKSKDYDVKLQEADSVQDFYDVITIDPTRTEAYLELNDYVASDDYVIDSEERSQLLQIQTGLVTKGANGYSDTVYVLDNLKESNKAGFDEVCFEIGWNLLAYYNADSDLDRYSMSSKWFKEIRGNDDVNGTIADIFCDIYDCMYRIKKLNEGKFIPERELKELKESFWAMMVSLKDKAKTFDEDYRIQVWIEINKMLDKNIVSFIEVSSADEMISIIDEIKANVEQMDSSNENAKKLIDGLKSDLDQTVFRIDTVEN